MTDRRYPWAALVEAMGVPESRAARTFGIGGTAMVRYRTQGLSTEMADKLAVRAGFHPSEVWPSWADDAIEDHGVDCPECETRFLPKRKDQKYCTTRCTNRVAKRAYAARQRATAEGRLANQQKCAEWRAQLSDAGRRAVAAKHRAWYRANRDRVLAGQRRRDHARRSRGEAA